MTRKSKTYKSPEDIINDPEWRLQQSDKARKNAEGVAKRKNREIEKKYPLFVEQIPRVTADQVLEQRRAIRSDVQERFAEIDRKTAEKTERYKEECRLLITDDAFQELLSRLESWGFAEEHYWYNQIQKIRARQIPLTDNERLILSMVRDWPQSEIPTAWDIFDLLSKSDDDRFKSHNDLAQVMHSLDNKSYVKGGLMRKVNLEIYNGYAVTWSIFLDENQDRKFNV